MLKEIAARPDAVSELSKSLDDSEYWEHEWTDSEFFIDVMYLLGIIKTKESFELIKEIIIKHNDELQETDFITQDLSIVLANFGEQYFDTIVEIVKDINYDEYVRMAAFSSLCTIAFLNNKFKQQLIVFSKALFNEDKYASDDFLLLVLHDMADLKDKELFEKVVEYEKLNDISPNRFTTTEELEKTYNSMTDEPECARTIKYLWGYFNAKKRAMHYENLFNNKTEDEWDNPEYGIEDEEEEIEISRHQQNWINKTYWINKGNKVYVGRNDKCPCGSGLKYKKCHGKPE